MSFGRLERPAGNAPMSDINMTPLIDVMLVLLVIFIITAPLLAGSLKLDLPRSDAATPTQSSAILEISMNAAGELYLGSDKVELAALQARAQAAAKARPHTDVQLRADSQVPYGRVAELIGVLQKTGLTRIGFVTEVPAGATAASAPN